MNTPQKDPESPFGGLFVKLLVFGIIFVLAVLGLVLYVRR